MKYQYINALRSGIAKAIQIEQLRLDANTKWLRLKLDGKIEGPEAITSMSLLTHIQANKTKLETLNQILDELIDAMDADGLHARPTVSIQPHPPEVLKLTEEQVADAQARFNDAEGRN